MENLVALLESYKNKKVFVTGHTGFKGSWLCHYLESLGALHAGYALAPYTNPSHFDLLKPQGTSTIADLSDKEIFSQSICDFQPEIVFHLAAQPLVRESYKDPVNTYQSNVIGTLNLLEAIRECPSVKAVVIITTDKVYENKEWVHPYREEDRLGGYDLYSSSKACSEILVRSYQRSFFSLEDFQVKHDVLISTVRAGNVIGGGDWSTDRLIPDIVKAAATKGVTNLRNPRAVRPWQHVLDCLHGYLMLGERLLKKETAFADAWNFAPYSFESMTVEEVAHVAQSVWEDISIEFGKPKDNPHEANLLKLDNTKAISLLGWKPKWNTEQAIQKTIEWYRTYYNDGELKTLEQIKEYRS